MVQTDKSQPVCRDNSSVVIPLSFVKTGSTCPTLDSVSGLTQWSPFEGRDGSSEKVSNLPRVTQPVSDTGDLVGYYMAFALCLIGTAQCLRIRSFGVKNVG